MAFVYVALYRRKAVCGHQVYVAAPDSQQHDTVRQAIPQEGYFVWEPLALGVSTALRNCCSLR
jgi:hypothetical protein